MVSQKEFELVLIVPFGVSELIFPWGVHFIRDYMENQDNGLKTRILDFRVAPLYNEMNQKYGSMLGELFLCLDSEQISLFFKHTSNPLLFLGLVGCIGTRFFELIPSSRSLKKKYYHQLQEFQAKLREYFTQRLTEVKKLAGNKRVIWCFSVYDYTLFNSLYLADIVKQIDPGSSILMGGDYFDFRSAQEIIGNTKRIDGIAVGYGEELLRKVMEGLESGKDIHDLEIPGFLHQGLVDKQDLLKAIMNIEPPPFYLEKNKPPIVKQPILTNERTIHALTQRGCSWGKCLFCTQLDKNTLFRFDFRYFAEYLEKAIRTSKYKMIDIILDSDENDADFLMKMIQFLEGFNKEGYCFQFYFWFQVKSFNKDLMLLLSRLNNNVIRIHMDLNFESMNSETLKHMRKGHTPLKAIESAKALQDCGQKFSTNYFEHYPLETRKGVKSELGYLKKTLHLFMPPKGRLNSFSYAANNRDEIFREEEKYNLKIRPVRKDFWINKIFDINVAFSFWAYVYKDRLSFNIDHLLSASWYEFNKELQKLSGPVEMVSQLWSFKKISTPEILRKIIHILKAGFWILFHLVFSLFKDGNVFMKRAKILDYLSSVDPDTSASKPLPQSFFLIRNNQLIKDYNGPACKEKFTMALNKNELKLLRFLYFIRTLEQVMDEFKNILLEKELKVLIEKHVGLGSIIRNHSLLLCPVNDPEYLVFLQKGN
ncbi:MAG: hypothetical protein JXN62_06160 [Bacteroidales bacterium]|nr:hypothetical protein [Bacteroidales bacterium]